MTPAPQMTVEDLKQRFKEVEEFLSDPNFKENYRRYIFLRRWMVEFGSDTTHSEQHRTEALLCSQGLKQAMHATVGLGHLAKKFEYKESALYGTPVPPTKHYFAKNLLTSACRVN